MRAVTILFFGTLLGISGSSLAACGGSADDAATPDAGGVGDNDAGTTDEPEASAPAPFPAFDIDAPQVISSGGPVLKAGSVTPVYFPGFDYATEMTDMTSKIGDSAYWAALSEYGVGKLTQATPVTLTSNDIQPADIGDISDTDIQAWLASRFDGTHPEFGTKPDRNTVYTLFYPPQTNIYLGGGGGGGDAGSFSGAKSCQSFGGYHNDILYQGNTIAYAVIPECPDFGNLQGVDVVTTTTSHELSEAATDPFPTDNTAYGQVDANHIAWEMYLGGGEVGDMCAQFSSSFYKPDDIGYIVQRNWSNKQAKAGHDPCQPELPGAAAYFNAAPIFPDSVTTRGFPTKGIKVPVGQSKTLELDLYSSGATSGPWTVSARTFTHGGSAPFTFAFDKTDGQNGDKLNVTITSTTAITSKSGSATIVIVSQLGDQKTIWIGLVSN